MQQQHPSGRFGRHIGIVVLTVAVSGLVLSACSNKANTSSSTSSVPASSSTTTPSATTSTSATSPTSTVPPTTTIPFAVSQVHTGTGPASLAEFSVPSNATEWDIDWVYNCSSTGGTGKFQVKVVGYGSASHTKDVGVSQTGAGTSGISRNYDTGTFSLDLTTPCKWTVRVEVVT